MYEFGLDSTNLDSPEVSVPATHIDELQGDAYLEENRYFKKIQQSYEDERIKFHFYKTTKFKSDSYDRMRSLAADVFTANPALLDTLTKEQVGYISNNLKRECKEELCKDDCTTTTVFFMLCQVLDDHIFKGELLNGTFRHMIDHVKKIKCNEKDFNEELVTFITEFNSLTHDLNYATYEILFYIIKNSLDYNFNLNKHNGTINWIPNDLMNCYIKGYGIPEIDAYSDAITEYVTDRYGRMMNNINDDLKLQSYVPRSYDFTCALYCRGMYSELAGYYLVNKSDPDKKEYDNTKEHDLRLK